MVANTGSPNTWEPAVGGQKFKVTLGCRVNSRLAWDAWDPVSREKKWRGGLMGEIVQWLGTLPAILEDWSLAPSPHLVAYN